MVSAMDGTVWWTDAFNASIEKYTSVDSNYVDGVSITYGSNPRKHVWTYAATRPKFGNVTVLVGSPYQAPSFIGSDYYCSLNSFQRTISSGTGRCLETMSLHEYPCPTALVAKKTFGILCTIVYNNYTLSLEAV